MGRFFVLIARFDMFNWYQNNKKPLCPLIDDAKRFFIFYDDSLIKTGRNHFALQGFADKWCVFAL